MYGFRKLKKRSHGVAFSHPLFTRDDTDENQWFVIDTDVSMASENFKPKGTFIRCNRKSWFRVLNKDGKPDLFSSQNILAHKATVQELIDNQDIWQKSEKMGSVDEL